MNRARILPLLLLALACGSVYDRPAQTVADPLLDMELLLRRARVLRVRYDVETSGAMKLLARGTLVYEGDHVRLDVSGSINGERKGTRYDRPYDRRREISESWVQIGLAHNLYRLMTGKEVESLGNTAENVKFEEGRYTFDIKVAGQRIGSAQLWVDAQGLPLRREQTMQFPQGEMKVSERYVWLP